MQVSDGLINGLTAAIVSQTVIKAGGIIYGHFWGSKELKKHTALLRVIARTLDELKWLHLAGTTEPNIPNTTPMLYGYDISRWQGEVDFDALKAAADFVIIRATYGTGLTDNQFVRNQNEARRVGIPCGYYHYGYPQYNRAEDEADWFVDTVGVQDGELLALDLEESCPDPVGWSLRFLNRVHERLGIKPLIYMNLSLANSQDWSPVVQGDYGLWLAVWNYNPEVNDFPTAWPVTAMRQYSNSEAVVGHHPVDANVFFGTLEQFNKYGYHQPIAQPVVVPLEDVPTPPVEIPIAQPEVQPPPEPPASSPVEEPNQPVIDPIMATTATTVDWSAAGLGSAVRRFILSILKTAGAAAVLYILAKLDSIHLTDYVAPQFALVATSALALVRGLFAFFEEWLTTQKA